MNECLTLKIRPMVNKPPSPTKPTTGVNSNSVYMLSVNHYYGNKMFDSLQFMKLLAMVLKVIINHISYVKRT